MPLILLFCVVVGSFAINNSLFGGGDAAGRRLGFYMERWGFPVAPTILGVVLGTMLEEHFFSSRDGVDVAGAAGHSEVSP